MTPIQNRLEKIQNNIKTVKNILKIQGRSDRTQWLIKLHMLEMREAQILALMEKKETK